MLEQEYPWYRIAEADEELEQGDFIDDCKILIPTYIPIEIEANMPINPRAFHAASVEEVRDVIIISQSCVLENRKVDFVHLCPRISYSTYVKITSNLGKNTKAILGNLNEIRLGRNYRYCMLNGCNLTNSPYEIQIVDLGTAYSIPCDVMKQMVKSSGDRIRLLSPYKEQLAQAFAYFYMRVALPNPIDEFKTIAGPMQIGTIFHHKG